MRKFLFLSLGLVIGSALCSAQNFAASTDFLGYTGSIVRYATLADAQAQTNAVGGPHAVNQRDASLFFTQNRPDVYSSNAAIFMTAWYYTIANNTNGFGMDDVNGNRYYSGWGNPNNTNTGFVQMYDLDSSSLTSYSGGWTSNAYDTFQLSFSGGSAGASEYARLWNAGSSGGPAGDTAGSFIEYAFNAQFSGLNGVLDGANYTATNHASSVTGAFTGIFQNTSNTNVGANGFYRFTLDLNTTNWAFSQGDQALNGNFSPSYFSAGSFAPVPEPMTMSLMGIGAVAAFRRIRRRKA